MSYRDAHSDSAVILACHMVALMQYLVFGLPRRACIALLGGLRLVVRLGSENLGAFGATYDPTSRTKRRVLSDDIAKDVKTILPKYNLDPELRSHVCCPNCFALFDTENCPPRCTFRETPSSVVCDAELLNVHVVRGKSLISPILKYHHQSFGPWLGRLFARDGIEDIIDRSLRSITNPPSSAVYDILHSPEFRQFKGPGTRDRVFLDNSDEPESARLIFALGADGFNPYGMKPAGPQISSTGIYIILLNLPPHMRYLPENTYLVGVIPGKPSLNQINHALKPLVDDFLPCWDPGLFLRRTAKYASGRRVYSALVPAVMDVLAGRQVSGFASATSTHFCPYCWITSDEMENFDSNTWQRRDIETHRRAAEAWRDASNVGVREDIFSRFGIRWSELLRLPYWDPIRFTLPESVHLFYLGLLEDHCRVMWGMSVDARDGDGILHPTRETPPLPSLHEMETAAWYLRHGTEAQIFACRKNVLWYLCADRDLRRSSTKTKMLNELRGWVSDFKPSIKTQAYVSQRAKEGFPVPSESRRPPVSGPSTEPGSSSSAQQPNSSTQHQQADRELPATDHAPQPPPTPASAAATTTTRVPGVLRGRHARSFPADNYIQGLPESLMNRSRDVVNAFKAFLLGQKEKNLAQRPRPILEYMCRYYGLGEGGTRAILADRLISHVCVRG